MSDAASFVRAVEERLPSLVDPAYREQIERLVPGVRAKGVRVPRLRALTKELVTEHGLELDAQCEAMDALSRTGGREEILIGAMALSRPPKRVLQLEWTRIEGWLAAVDNWETCDLIALSLAAPLVTAQPELVERLRVLATRERVWERRFAVATSAALNQKGRTNVDATLSICALVVGDREPMVRKAIAWALREASERDADAVRGFLAEHGGALGRGLVREASKKL
ncbi:MAG: DNA alkylation repair protein [Sandaracinaceae bacterium]